MMHDGLRPDRVSTHFHAQHPFTASLHFARVIARPTAHHSTAASAAATTLAPPPLPSPSILFLFIHISIHGHGHRAVHRVPRPPPNVLRLVSRLKMCSRNARRARPGARRRTVYQLRLRQYRFKCITLLAFELESYFQCCSRCHFHQDLYSLCYKHNKIAPRSY